VHIAARVMDLADAGEFLGSHAMVEQLAGSNFTVTMKGRYALKGVADEWLLFLADLHPGQLHDK